MVSGSHLPQLKVFEMKKLDELLKYNADCAGVRIDIADFSDRIREYGNWLQDMDRGFFPFWYGNGLDYWAGMSYGLPLKVSL